MINNNKLNKMVLEYAKYTCNYHSNEDQDIEMLNKIFKTNIKWKDVFK